MSLCRIPIRGYFTKRAIFLQFSAGLAGESRSGLNEKRYVYILPSDTMKQNRVMPQEKVDVKREDLCIY
jgi:hypothetical protein